MKKKGFTLIELLAVIVILAVIALITVPQVIKILYKVRLSAAEDSAYGIINAAENYVALNLLSNHNKISQNIEFNCDKTGCLYNSEILEYKGKKAIKGKIIIVDNGSKIALDKLVINGFTCNKGIDEDKVNCVEGNGEIVDKNKGIICGDGKEEDYDNIDICYINSIEDYESFYSLVNSGKNFSGKTVYLMKDLDLFNLKNIESIGTYSNSFNGTFEGNGYKISNATINGWDNTGLFGYIGNNGKVQGLNLENITVNGEDYVGIVAGRNDGTIDSVRVSGTVNATGNYVGGIAGYSNYSYNFIVYDTKVNGTGSNRNLGIGLSASKMYGIVESGIIDDGGGITNKPSSYLYTYSEDIKIGDSYITSYYYDKSKKNDINYYNEFIDTIINGDNDGNGYYYDYNEIGELAVKSVKREPITINLKQNESGEYLIYTNEDLKDAAKMTASSSTVYRLMNDLDFKNDKYYMLGNTANNFNGTFEGNGYKISNATINGWDNTGLFGYIGNNGKVQGLNLENITVNGEDYVGIVAGRNDGTIDSVRVSGTVNATGNYVGGIAGYSINVYNFILHDAVVNATGSNRNLAIGYAKTNLYGIIESGSISSGGRITDKSTYYDYAYSNLVKIGDIYQTSGFDSTNIGDLDYYNSYGILENIGFKNSKNGYYFDYDINNNIVVKCS